MFNSKNLLLIGLLTLTIRYSQAQEQSYLGNPTQNDGHGDFVPFKKFLDQVRHAEYKDYNNSRVRDEEAFNEMKNHVLKMYEGVGTVSSFVLDHAYADCIAIKEQPSVHQHGIHEIAQPPIGSRHDRNTYGRGPGRPSRAESPLKLGLKDGFGHPISCPKDAIPVARLTLEKLTRFKTLKDFFSKGAPPEVRAEELHLHAQGRQYVTNFGGNSWLDLWNPKGDFSISQQWYYGTSEGNATQSLEGGWVVDRIRNPDSDRSVLFIYYTPDWYKTGCWNNDCGQFVQINHNWYLGGPWDHYSTIDGEQWGFELQWKFYQGNWWLFLRGPGDYEAVGYYPASAWNGGQLSKSSNVITYGGEVANYTGGDDFPQMGSGLLADRGWEEAAFQSTIFWIPRNEDDGVGVWANLAAQDEGKPACYTVDLVNWPSGGDWGTYFYFGGPGGFGCVL